VAFSIERLDLEGLVHIFPRVISDSRGSFRELYKASDFADLGLESTFVQDNLVESHKGALRGLHFQYAPKAQGKLITCLKGKVWDVAVDLRKDSGTYGKFCGLELSEAQGSMLYVPPGFAHGYLCLSDTALVHYKCTQEYDPLTEAGVRYDDASLNIPWPLIHAQYRVSEKDKALPFLKDLGERFYV